MKSSAIQLSVLPLRGARRPQPKGPQEGLTLWREIAPDESSVDPFTESTGGKWEAHGSLR
eukprot:1161741-Pelagomonas_calceolata.AAC.2